MNNFIPEEIILNILTRLPGLSVLNCKLVCKTWLSLISHSSFAHMHLIQQLDHPNDSTGKVGFFFTTQYNFPLCYGEYNYDQKSKKSRMKVRRFKVLPPQTWIIGSCNGLVCLSDRYYVWEPIIICNPMTREYVNLPIFRFPQIYWVCVGFGYNSSTNEYKVVKIDYSVSDDDTRVGNVEVYTLGSDRGWRNVGETTYLLVCDKRAIYSTGTFADGALHWMEHNTSRIVAFDLTDESLRVLPSPPCFDQGVGEYSTFGLGVFGRLLSVTCDRSNGKVELWLYNKENSNDISDKDDISHPSCWSMELIIKVDSSIDCFLDDKPLILLTKSREFYFCSISKLYLYDTKTTEVKGLVDVCMYNLYQVVPDHRNTFVSSRALEKKTKNNGNC